MHITDIGERLEQVWNGLSVFRRISLINSMGLTDKVGKIDYSPFECLPQSQQLMMIHTATAMDMV